MRVLLQVLRDRVVSAPLRRHPRPRTPAAQSLANLIQVSQELPFLHPSEASVLNRICKLGSDYIRFTEFIEQHTGHVHQQVSLCPPAGESV
uniref:Uncharacterized protein n=1 Tax=Oryzias sinensis TaxID=183150 RepID=A0A8C7WXM0_9TELE